MSTTFDVYPRSGDLPTFAALVKRAQDELHRLLASLSVQKRPPIHVNLKRSADHTNVAFSLGDALQWSSDAYAWFTVGNIAGGTDAYYICDPAEVRMSWEGRQDPRVQRLQPVVDECISTGHYWSFRRSMGQSAVINLSYGLIAGTLAAMTDGFIDSYDGAWDTGRLPARPDEFLSAYFRPTTDCAEEHRIWTARNLEMLEKELTGEN